MKNIILICAAMFAAAGAFAQELTDAQKAVLEAAQAYTDAEQVEKKPEKKPTNWTTNLKTQINVGQTSLTNWAAGGDNTVSLQGFVDGNANWKLNEMFWNNRLQLDYGFLYTSSKPIFQKNSDRIYLESKWGYKAYKEVLYFSANYDFKSQFSNTYDYPTPTTKADGTAFGENEKPIREDWIAFKKLKSGFLAPAYTNLALGIDYKPFKWLSVNFAPVTGGFVIVKDEDLRASYSMPLKKQYEGKTEGVPTDGSQYESSRFEFGAQMKIDAAVNINDNFKYSTQVVLFSDYLDKPENLRVNWDNRFEWKLAKYFSLTFVTNLIYDDKVKIQTPEEVEQGIPGKQRVQFKESLAFGFTYTIANKK